MELFKQRINRQDKMEANLPASLACADCGKESLTVLIHLNGSACPFCGGLFRMPANKRIQQIADADTFCEIGKEKISTNPLNFPQYSQKLSKAQKATNISEAIVTGTCSIGAEPCGLAVMDSYFMMGSMGEIVGEKICDLVELCIQKGLPLVIFCASGGARMQEGMISLLQMTRTTIAINKLGEQGLVYISVLTNPTTGGVTASFAMQGDVILAEPKALIGFAGPRVIAQTVNEDLPDEFQTTEYLFKQGMIDKIVKREDMKENLRRVLALHKKEAHDGK